MLTQFLHPPQMPPEFQSPGTPRRYRRPNPSGGRARMLLPQRPNEVMTMVAFVSAVSLALAVAAGFAALRLVVAGLRLSLRRP
jgi:hypothetical protein